MPEAETFKGATFLQTCLTCQTLWDPTSIVSLSQVQWAVESVASGLNVKAHWVQCMDQAIPIAWMGDAAAKILNNGSLAQVFLKPSSIVCNHTKHGKPDFFRSMPWDTQGNAICPWRSDGEIQSQ